MPLGDLVGFRHALLRYQILNVLSGLVCNSYSSVRWSQAQVENRVFPFESCTII